MAVALSLAQSGRRALDRPSLGRKERGQMARRASRSARTGRFVKRATRPTSPQDHLDRSVSVAAQRTSEPCTAPRSRVVSSRRPPPLGTRARPSGRWSDGRRQVHEDPNFKQNLAKAVRPALKSLLGGERRSGVSYQKTPAVTDAPGAATVRSVVPQGIPDWDACPTRSQSLEVLQLTFGLRDVPPSVGTETERDRVVLRG